MTKYYYTDPLAAAWMAKHFGMEFEESQLSCSTLEHRMTGVNVISPHSGKIIIESVHLLEPEVGDILQDISPPYLPSLLSIHDGGRIKGKRIIQRNGIPFMWPETETTKQKDET